MESPQPDRKNWLSELSGQSWNLEMLISGAAIYSTSFLPELMDSVLDSFFENYLMNDQPLNLVLPIMAYGVAKTASYFLIATFVVHFVLRAFWVGMVGLRAVYPDGIVYEKLPKVNEQLRENYRKTFGDSDDFIIRLDRLCSQIFSIAFVLVLFSLIMAIMYLGGFVFAVFFKSLAPKLFAEWGGIINNVLMVVFFSFAGFFLILSQKRMREHPYWGKFYTQMANSSKWMYFGLYKPMNHIMLVFASHVSYRRYLGTTIGITITFFTITVAFFAQKLFEHNGLPWLESRQFYSSGSFAYQLLPNQYDNLRSEGERIAEASIQSDVVRDPFLKIFINYTRSIDAGVEQICKVPIAPDSLRRQNRRKNLDKARMECIQQYFQITLNDSVYQNIDYLYETHSVQKTPGISTYIATKRLVTGRNTLTIKIIDPDSLPKRHWQIYTVIPFWFAPEN